MQRFRRAARSKAPGDEKPHNDANYPSPVEQANSGVAPPAARSSSRIPPQRLGNLSGQVQKDVNLQHQIEVLRGQLRQADSLHQIELNSVRVDFQRRLQEKDAEMARMREEYEETIRTLSGQLKNEQNALSKASAEISNLKSEADAGALQGFDPMQWKRCPTISYSMQRAELIKDALRELREEERESAAQEAAGVQNERQGAAAQPSSAQNSGMTLDIAPGIVTKPCRYSQQRGQLIFEAIEEFRREQAAELQ